MKALCGGDQALQSAVYIEEMHKRSPSRVPLVVAILLLFLPLLYLGSYFSLVVPSGNIKPVPGMPGNYSVEDYRLCSESAHQVFWPLERFDRQLRPRAWDERARREARIRVILEQRVP